MRKGSRDPAKWLTKTCPQCGNAFECRISTPTRAYCSMPCKNRGISPPDPTKRVDTTCPKCGKAFWYHQSWPRKYCSKSCSSSVEGVKALGVVPSKYTTTCEQCGKLFETVPSLTRGRFCSMRCWGDWQSANLRGEQTGYWKGGVSLKRPAVCTICGKDFIANPATTTGKFCSRACTKRWKIDSGMYGGENNPNWRGGYLPYYGASWPEARRQARERDGRCLDCGVLPEALGKALDVHHIVPFRTFGMERHEEANVLTNLMSLCPVCHQAREWRDNRR